MKRKPTTLFLEIFLLIAFSLSFKWIIVSTQDTTGFFYCSDEFCEEATRNKPCPVQRNCSTVGFRTFLDPSECNCCSYCFDYLKENATCSPVSNQKPTEMCGPYLECQPAERDSDPAICKPIQSRPKLNPDPNFCMAKRKQYTDARDAGNLGIVQFLPECGSGGDYAPRQCIPGSVCYCSNKRGEKIFGLALPSENQDCACARDVANLQEFGFDGRFPHCLSNGDYDELQCVVRSCFCRSYPDVIKPPQNMSSLPCFDKSIHVFDPETPIYYAKPCEVLKAQAEIEVAEAELKGTLLVVSDPHKCDPDGTFAPIQTLFDRQFCADPVSKSVLEDFQVEKYSDAAKAMNCNCARARYLMRQSATGKPQCCKNGNFKKLQHLGSTWFCVDDYGRQNITELPFEVYESQMKELPCYKRDGGNSTDPDFGCRF